MELLALLLNLVLSFLEADLSTPSLPLLGYQLRNQLLVLLLRCTQGLTGLGVKVSLDPSFVAGIFYPLLSHEYLLDSLRKNNKGTPCQKRKGKPSMKLGRHDKKITKAKSLFRDRKRSCCLMVCSATISLGSSRGCSRASAR